MPKFFSGHLGAPAFQQNPHASRDRATATKQVGGAGGSLVPPGPFHLDPAGWHCCESYRTEPERTTLVRKPVCSGSRDRPVWLNPLLLETAPKRGLPPAGMEHRGGRRQVQAFERALTSACPPTWTTSKVPRRFRCRGTSRTGPLGGGRPAGCGNQEEKVKLNQKKRNR